MRVAHTEDIPSAPTDLQSSAGASCREERSGGVEEWRRIHSDPPLLHTSTPPFRKKSFAAFRMAAVAVAVVAGGCAHVEPPPGGPDDQTPPSVVSTSPEDEAVVTSYDGPVVFEFSERISQSGVEDAVIVSPRTSPVEISPGRSAVRVSLRNGWEPNVIYQITLRPEIRDLFNNPIAGAVHLVFSTGPPIPDTRIAGSVVDRITGRAADDVRLEAIRMADSLVYAVATGREGNFELARIPEGEYLVRAFDDVNRNRALDTYEARDSTFATLTDSDPVDVTFRILAPDSTAPTIDEVTAEARRVEIEFDDYLDPEQPIQPGQVTILHPTDGPVEIGRVAIGEMPPLDTVPATVPADTAAAIPADPAAAPSPADSAGVIPADTAAAIPTDPAAAPSPADTAGVIPADTAAALGAQPAVPPISRDSAGVDPTAPGSPATPLAAETAPASQTLIVELGEGAELEPGVEYEVTVRDVRNVNGLTGDATATLETEAAPPDL